MVGGYFSGLDGFLALGAASARDPWGDRAVGVHRHDLRLPALHSRVGSPFDGH